MTELQTAYRKVHDWFVTTNLERVKDVEDACEYDGDYVVAVDLCGAVSWARVRRAITLDEHMMLCDDIARRLHSANDSLSQLRTIPDRAAMIAFFAEGAGIEGQVTA